MKLDFDYALGGGPAPVRFPSPSVVGETDVLTDVLLCRPTYLDTVPCCSVTRESIRDGFTVSREAATQQHAALEAALVRNGVRCTLLPESAGLPDLCFTRDTSVMTPWGLLGLRPAASHRRDEVLEVLGMAMRSDIPLLGSVEHGTVEGGDVCVARPGLVIIGSSSERTDDVGATAIADLFRSAGWAAEIYRFDPHFLHLDTQFCMVAEDLALACTDVLSDDFLMMLSGRGIETLPVSYKEARRLGCNVLSLGRRRVLSSSDNRRVNDLLSARGFEVEAIDVSQFARCGGGIHCLTMPINRTNNGPTERSKR